MITSEEAKNYIRLFLNKTFDIREGEVTRSVFMMIYIFLIISSLLIVKPVATSLFLSNFGVEQLPYAFLLVALSAAVISTIYARALKTILLKKIIVGTLYLSITALLIFWTLIKFNFLEGWALYLFYIWMSIFGVLSASQFWILANIIFNAREAKRLFSFIGAGAIGGGIFGGYLTTLLVPILSSENLLLVSVFFLLLCIPLANMLWNKNVKMTQTKIRQKKRTASFGDHPIALISRSKHLTFLASIVGISVIVAKLVDYQFNAIASREILDEDQLTAFFGFWFSNLNIISLIIQIFLTRKVVGIFGVGTSLLFLPGGILVGAVSILFFPYLWSAILLKISDGSLKQSINKAGIELLALPIPVNVKNQAKTFIDVFVDSLATGLGGVLLIVVVIGLDLDIRFLSLIAIVLIGLWIYLALKIRQEYIKSFKAKIDYEKDTKKQIVDLSSASVIGGLIKVLESGTEKQILHILKMTKEIQNERLLPYFAKLLKHPVTEIKLEVLRNIYFYKNADYKKEVIELINDSSKEVRVEVFHYLFEHSKADRINLIKKYLNEPDYKISAPALLAIAYETRDNLELRRVLAITKLLKSKLDDLTDESDIEKTTYVKAVCIKAIGISRSSSLYEYIEKSFNDPSREIVEASIFAAGQTLDQKFIYPLVNFLDSNELKIIAQRSILNFGHSIVFELNKFLESDETEVEIKRSIPEILGSIGSQESVNILLSNLENEDLQIRNESLKALNLMRINFAHLKINQKNIVKIILEEAKVYLDTLALLYSQIEADKKSTKKLAEEKHVKIRDARNSLIDLLERRLDGNLERIFRLLGLKYPPQEMLSAYKSIQSSTPDIRINAVEYLDNMLDSSLKRVVIPLIETAMLETISEGSIANFNLQIPSEYECLEMLMNGKDIRLKMATLYLINQLKSEKYLTLVEKFTDNENQKLRYLAAEALKNIQQSNN